MRSSRNLSRMLKTMVRYSICEDGKGAPRVAVNATVADQNVVKTF
jgi:hypothetical protein